MLAHLVEPTVSNPSILKNLNSLIFFYKQFSFLCILCDFLSTVPIIRGAVNNLLFCKTRLLSLRSGMIIIQMRKKMFLLDE